MITRRRFLQSLSVGSIVGLAGCGTPPDPPEPDTPTTDTPSGTIEFSGVRPETLPDNRPSMLQCKEKSWTQHPVLTNLGQVTLGSTGSLELRVTSTNISVGETFKIRLKNTGDSSQTVAPKSQYNLQVYTTNGWQEIRWMKKQVDYSSDMVKLQPGESFIWMFYSTTEGMVAEHPQNDKLVVCPEIQTGRYRFVFSNPAVSVQFNIYAESTTPPTSLG